MTRPIVLRRQVRRTCRQCSLDAIDFDLAPGRIRGLVGSNGVGKGLVNALLFLIPAAAGGVLRRARRCRPSHARRRVDLSGAHPQMA